MTRKFRINQRVRLSKLGRKSFLLPKTKQDTSGVVTFVNKLGMPTVKWDNLRTPRNYHSSFIVEDRRLPRNRPQYD